MREDKKNFYSSHSVLIPDGLEITLSA